MTGWRSHLDRRALFASGAAAALLAATGVSANGVPRRGGRFRAALSGAARSDTWQSGDGLFMQVARQGLVFDTLTEIAANGTLRGELATGWRTSDGAREWQFDLRPGVTFHDESPLRAQDVVESLSGPLMDRGTIKVTSSHSVLISLDAPDAQLPFNLTEGQFVIRPENQQDSAIGTGLYRLREFTAGRRLIAERVSSHYKDGLAGWFDEVELVALSLSEVRLQAVAEHLVDAADISESELVLAMPDASWQPTQGTPLQVVSNAIGQPGRIGQQLALDDLRAAERWWFA